MEKLPMCRICLAENVRMYVVVNRDLQELYEKLSDIPFVTEDIRPILACYFCCAKLKQCYRLLRQCQEAEDLFAQMINEDYEVNPLINQDQLEFYNGFIKSPIEHISIDDECQTGSIDIKEELPAVCERLDDIIEPKEEHRSYGTIDAMKPKLDTRRTKLEDAITAEQTKKEKSNSNVMRTTQKRTSKTDNYLKKIIHPRTQIDEKPYKCNVCHRSFSAKRNLTEHIHIHTGEKPYKCNVCHRSFGAKSNLLNHIRVHTGAKSYKCDVCQCSFNLKGNLTKHIRIIHTGEKLFKCDVCQRSFSVKSNLTKHIRIHTGEKPYKCDVCQRSFREKGDLTKHIRVHTGEKPFKCDVCQNSFSQKSSLTQHGRIHTGEKPYKCAVCQRTFSEKSILTRHIRKHY